MAVRVNDDIFFIELERGHLDLLKVEDNASHLLLAVQMGLQVLELLGEWLFIYLLIEREQVVKDRHSQLCMEIAFL